jgi:hypothetical protein
VTIYHVLKLFQHGQPADPNALLLQAVLWIRIRIHMFLGLPYPDHYAKNSKKNLDSCYFVTLFDFLSLEKDVNVASKSNQQKKLC